MAKHIEENGMVIVMLSINGKMKGAECDDMVKAEKEVEKWLKEARKSFPNGYFKPVYVIGTKLEN